MSLMGIDVGTTGCKALVFSNEGGQLAYAYEEYDIQRPQPGWAELDAVPVWESVKRTVARTAAAASKDPVTAISVCSLGEAVVPVAKDRRILGPSILNMDVRGEEYVPCFREAVTPERLYQINGNTLGNSYTATKLMWHREHQPDLYAKVDKFLHWGAFVNYMLGAEPVVDYSLANRSLLFDLDNATWSDELLTIAGLDREKFPDTSPSGTVVGEVSTALARELGLPDDVALVTGAHDQCANAIGCGALNEGQAMLGMGTFTVICLVFGSRKDTSAMLGCGLNTEHHAAPGRFVAFIYNQGGSHLKWFRDTFAAVERKHVEEQGNDIYDVLLSEMPEAPSGVLLLPHFAPTGPPHFVSDSCGVVAGLTLETTRGDLLKGLLEGVVFGLRECVELLPDAGLELGEFRAAGGGSKSDAWLQIYADIMGRPVTRVRFSEAGGLGAAILAGAATGAYGSLEDGAAAAVELGETFEPDDSKHSHYDRRFEQYRRLWPLMKDYLRELT